MRPKVSGGQSGGVGGASKKMGGVVDAHVAVWAVRVNAGVQTVFVGVEGLGPARSELGQGSTGMAWKCFFLSGNRWGCTPKDNVSAVVANGSCYDVSV